MVLAMVLWRPRRDKRWLIEQGQGVVQQRVAGGLKVGREKWGQLGCGACGLLGAFLHPMQRRGDVVRGLFMELRLQLDLVSGQDGRDRLGNYGSPTFAFRPDANVRSMVKHGNSFVADADQCIQVLVDSVMGVGVPTMETARGWGGERERLAVGVDGRVKRARILRRISTRIGVLDTIDGEGRQGSINANLGLFQVGGIEGAQLEPTAHRAGEHARTTFFMSTNDVIAEDDLDWAIEGVADEPQLVAVGNGRQPKQPGDLLLA